MKVLLLIDNVDFLKLIFFIFFLVVHSINIKLNMRIYTVKLMTNMKTMHGH